jgi:hypothetical protein
VSGDNLIYSLGEGADDQRIEDPIPGDAVDQVVHLGIFPDLEGLVFEIPEPLRCDLNDSFIGFDFH